MLTAIIINENPLRDALVGLVSGIKQTHSESEVTFYQKNNYIFAFSDSLTIRDIFETTLSEYQPEKIFIAKTGRSVDTEHEIGDVVLPNVFFSFDEKILSTEITSENRDSLIGKAKFLEIFDEQKDYFVEDFGLSIGGIIVENTPPDADAEKIMSVYEADAYLTESQQSIVEIIEENLIPTLFVVGIVSGKIGKFTTENPYHQVATNIMTTIRLVNNEENL